MNSKITIKELEEIEKPSASISLIFSNRHKNSLQGLEKFKNLVSHKQIDLDVSGNNLINFIPEILGLKFLKKLNLSHNNISEVWDLPQSLEQLMMTNNSISTLGKVVPSLFRLHTLDLSFNLLDSVAAISNLPYLRCFYVSNNRISSLENIENFNSLLEIDLENNLITYSQIDAFSKNQSICAVNFRNNPICTYFLFRELRNNEICAKEYHELQLGIFCRNIEKLKEIKSSKFRIVIKKSQKEENSKNPLKKITFSSRKASMQEIYDQVINEDPEMEESLNSSESEEKFISNDENVKKPSIAKLHLEKIVEKNTDKVSYEKWSTKPELTIEYFFEDIIQYYQIDENFEKGLGSCDKYEFVANFLKKREEQRKNLIRELNSLQEKVKMIEIENRNLEKKILELEKKLKKSDFEFEKIVQEKAKISEEFEKQSKSLACLTEENSEISKKSLKKIEELEEKLKDFENESKNSSRFNFSCSFDSDSPYYLPDSPEIAYSRLINSGEIIVAKPVGEYINRLLQKISNLASKTKKLRLQREKLKFILDKSQKKTNLH